MTTAIKEAAKTFAILAAYVLFAVGTFYFLKWTGKGSQPDDYEEPGYYRGR